jgi:hypothetical protein
MIVQRITTCAIAMLLSGADNAVTRIMHKSMGINHHFRSARLLLAVTSDDPPALLLSRAECRALVPVPHTYRHCVICIV